MMPSVAAINAITSSSDISGVSFGVGVGDGAGGGVYVGDGGGVYVGEGGGVGDGVSPPLVEDCVSLESGVGVEPEQVPIILPV
jgi:hypothetical protein